MKVYFSKLALENGYDLKLHFRQPGPANSEKSLFEVHVSCKQEAIALASNTHNCGKFVFCLNITKKPKKAPVQEPNNGFSSEVNCSSNPMESVSNNLTSAQNNKEMSSKPIQNTDQQERHPEKTIMISNKQESSIESKNYHKSRVETYYGSCSSSAKENNLQVLRGKERCVNQQRTNHCNQQQINNSDCGSVSQPDGLSSLSKPKARQTGPDEIEFPPQCPSPDIHSSELKSHKAFSVNVDTRQQPSNFEVYKGREYLGYTQNTFDQQALSRPSNSQLVTNMPIYQEKVTGKVRGTEKTPRDQAFDAHRYQNVQGPGPEKSLSVNLPHGYLLNSQVFRAESGSSGQEFNFTPQIEVKQPGNTGSQTTSVVNVKNEGNSSEFDRSKFSSILQSSYGEPDKLSNDKIKRIYKLGKNLKKRPYTIFERKIDHKTKEPALFTTLSEFHPIGKFIMERNDENSDEGTFAFSDKVIKVGATQFVCLEDGFRDFGGNYIPNNYNMWNGVSSKVEDIFLSALCRARLHGLPEETSIDSKLCLFWQTQNDMTNLQRSFRKHRQQVESRNPVSGERDQSQQTSKRTSTDKETRAEERFSIGLRTVSSHSKESSA